MGLRGLALVAVTLTACDELRSLARPAQVAFEIEPRQPTAGEEFSVRFSILADEHGEQYEVCLEPGGAGFEQRRGCEVVPRGARVVRMVAPTPGEYSVRVMGDRVRGRRVDPPQMIAHLRVTVR